MMLFSEFPVVDYWDPKDCPTNTSKKKQNSKSIKKNKGTPKSEPMVEEAASYEWRKSSAECSVSSDESPVYGNFRLCKSATNSLWSSSASDNSLSDNLLLKTRKYKCKVKRNLPPIGVFWDIENCQVPKHKSAAKVVQRIREYFFEDHTEAEFLVVCDVRKENAQIIQELHDAQVNLIHVSSISKNAADEKLRQSLRRFAETHPAPATVVLITSDVNFASDLTNLRYRKKLHVILVHNSNVADALILCANETYLFSIITDNLPIFHVKPLQTSQETVDLLVSNLPTTFKKKPLKNRLKFLSDNCGGRVVDVDPQNGTAVIRFSTIDFATRAQRRLNGEDVFGRKISVQPISESSASRKNGEPKGNFWSSQGSARLNWRSLSTRTSELPAASTFKPIQPQPNKRDTYSPVELLVTNLDGSIKDLKSTLTNIVKQYVTVFTIKVFYDPKPSAMVKVSSQQDAEYLVSKMHHLKLGLRRITISYSEKLNDLNELRERVVYLLKESDVLPMPLYMLLNLLKERYLMRVSLCEINKLKDVCQIEEENGERLISLTPEMSASPSLQKPQQFHYCYMHCPNGLPDASNDESELPSIYMPLQEFSQKLNFMLSTHMGTLPLMSFMMCYSHEFGQQLPLDNICGVPLEHLITCVLNVRVKEEGAKNKVKYIVWETADKEEESVPLKASPLASNIGLLRREFVDLIKSSPKCQIPLTKFVPAYHHHFGRQLRVADYGYTKLDHLLQSTHLIGTVQIMGDGSNRILTLTHSTQMRRFTSDLLRLLKSQVSKQIYLSEFSDVYFRIFEKPFSAIEYGLCTIDDLLEEVPKSSIVITKSESDVAVALPKRIRTSSEILRTKQFAEEVVKLLSHSPQGSMLFEKFVPHYHHHFGHQCKVSDYGFTKLIELFEAIPQTVKVSTLPNGQRKITMTAEQALQLVSTRIGDLLKKSWHIPLESLPAMYLREYKCELNPQMYNCADLKELIYKLRDTVNVVYSSAGPLLTARDKHSTEDSLNAMSLRVWCLLINPPYHCEADLLIAQYFGKFNENISIYHLDQLSNIIVSRTQNSKYLVFLIPEYVKAAKLYNLLLMNGGQLPLNYLNSMYETQYGESLFLENTCDVYEKFFSKYSFLLLLSRSGRTSIVALNTKLKDVGLAIEKEAPKEAAAAWPPSVSSVLARRHSPPKPDTPPSHSAAPWSTWRELSPKKRINSVELDFYINLPLENMQSLLLDSKLISPAKNLLPAHPHAPMISYFNPPNPEELPVPDKLLKKGNALSDDSADSGVNASENEMDVS